MKSFVVTIIFLLMYCLGFSLSQTLPNPAASSPVPGADQSRITIKNSIVYHVVKNVKAIESDIFVSRKIDVGPISNGILEINQIEDRVGVLCKQIPKIISEVKYRAAEKVRNIPRFKQISLVDKASHVEAKMRCESLGMTLPEIYNSVENVQLKKFMTDNQISHTHAGIYFDEEHSIQRFYSTGLPIWQAYQHTLQQYKPSKFGEISWGEVQGKSDAKFLYTVRGQLAVFFEDSPSMMGRNRNKFYRDTNKELREFSARIVCQNKIPGDGVFGGNFRKNPPEGWTILPHTIPDKSVLVQSKKKRKRSIKTPSPNATIEDTPLEQCCVNVVGHLHELGERANIRLTSLLELVDITINSHSGPLVKRDAQFNDTELVSNSSLDVPQSKTRNPRGLPAFLFMNGVRSIWSLLGFVEKIRTNRRLNRLEEAVGAQNEQVDKLSKEVAKHSIAISQLQISTQDLDRRIEELTGRVTNLEQRVGTLETELRLQQILEFIDGLVGRAEEAMNYGFTKLESIIHMSLIGQTSAFLLPPDKLQEVQNQLNKDSTAIIDSEYKHMKSIIVSDPDKQSSILLAVVNIVALSRKSKELVKLLPMPAYQGITALVPLLDYNAAILDQEAGTFTVVENDELPSCLNDHCVTSNPEINIAAASCGIPQFFDRQTNACNFEEIATDGIFLKRMQLDGIVFNVREEVTAQIFCNAQGQSKAYKLKGLGVVNLPPGCILSLTDKNGQIRKIKSLPIAQMIEFHPVDIIVAGPEQIFYQSNHQQINGTSGLTKLINAHLGSLSDKLDGTSEVIRTQGRYVIILASLLGVTVGICAIIAGLLYHYSSRFRRKVTSIKEELREGFEQATQKFHLIEQKVRSPGNDHMPPPQRGARGSPPPVPPQSLKTILLKLEKLEEKISQSDGYLDLSMGKTEPIYHNTKSEKHYSAPPSSGFKLYPTTRLMEEIEQSKLLLRPVSEPDPSAPSSY